MTLTIAIIISICIPAAIICLAFWGSSETDEDSKPEPDIKEEPVVEESPMDKYERAMAEQEAKINEKNAKNNAIYELKNTLREKVRVLKNARNWDKYLSKRRCMLGVDVIRPTPVSYYEPTPPMPSFSTSRLGRLRARPTPSMYEYDMYMERLEWSAPWMAVLMDYNKAIQEGYDFTDSGIEAVQKEVDTRMGEEWIVPKDFIIPGLEELT